MLLTGVKDLDTKILSELEDVDLVKMCQVNRKADEICKDQGFWLNRIMLKFPYLGLDILNRYKQGRSWSEYYIKDLRKINIDNVASTLSRESRNGRLDRVIISMNQGADIHSFDDYAVRWASYNGQLDVVRYLANNGANIHADNANAVRFASENGHLEVVRYLVNEKVFFILTVSKHLIF